MKEYLKAQMKTNHLLVNGLIRTDEIDRLSKSDQRWADNRHQTFQTRKVKKGEIYHSHCQH